MAKKSSGKSSDNIDRVRERIAEACLAEAVFDGWTWQAAEKAAIAAGYAPEMARAVFPGGIADILDEFAAMTDRAMLARLAKIDPKSLRIRDRIRIAVMTRIELLAPHREAEKLAARFWAVPSRHLQAGRILWRSADVIWTWAGDTATDYNRYTKRGLLCGVMASTMMVWLNQREDSMEIVSGFLDRRIENVMQFGRFLGKIRKAA